MFLIIAALENIVKIYLFICLFIFLKNIILIYLSFLFDIIVIVNIHIFNLCWFEIFFYPLRPDGTALPDSSKLFTDNNQGIVWVCFNDLSGTGFEG